MSEVTKKQAVAILIEGAIRAHNDGDQICAITLAGAAEEAMPKAEETLFVMLRELGSMLSNSHKLASEVLNFERNWLKHYNASEPDAIEITGSFVMIRRAQSRFRAVYGEFEETPMMRKFFDAGS